MSVEEVGGEFNPRAEAVQELRSRLDDIRAARNDEEGEEFDGVYGVESEPVVTLTLAGGGPSAWIEYKPNRGTAMFYTTAPGYAQSHGVTSVELTREEVELLDIYAEVAGV